MTFQQIRTTALIAIAAHDDLCELLVLKGGNALELIHKIGNRSSLDLDFSMRGDVADQSQLKGYLDHAITDRFDAKGFVVFDTSIEFKPRPKTGIVPSWWGGYSYKFKIIPRSEYKLLQLDLQTMRRRATIIGDNHQRTFEIQISRTEYCEGSISADVDGFILQVYSTSMIACEKLRAICQQLPEYEVSQGVARSPRARDFYDIYQLAAGGHFPITADSSIDLLKAMFSIKNVPIGLLLKLKDEREFHRLDWPKVQHAVSGPIHEFDFYFDYVITLINELQRLGMINPP